MGALLYLLGISILSMPHGDLDDRIRDASEAILQHPDSASLYLTRGELYLLHEEPVAAKADFEVCLGIGFSNGRVFLGLSKSRIAFDPMDSALYYVNRALEPEPENAAVLEWKGHVLQCMGRHCESAATYAFLISLSSQAAPSLFLSAAEEWSLCQEATAEQNAIDILIEGLSRLGPIHILEKELVHVYLQYGRYDDAVRMQTDIIAQWPVKIVPFVERAQTYVLLGDGTSARNDLTSALEALDGLPPHRSNTSAMKEMRRTIVATLDKLNQ